MTGFHIPSFVPGASLPIVLISPRKFLPRNNITSLPILLPIDFPLQLEKI